MTSTARERPTVPAPLLVLAAIASVQVGSAVARTLFDDLGAAGVTLLRLSIAAVILGVAFRPRVGGWTSAAWRAAVLLGVAMASMNLLFYLALRTVPLGVGVTVEFLGPLLLTLVQTRRLVDLLWALLAAGGVALLGLGSGLTAPLGGLLLAFAAGLCWAGYILASAHLGTLVPGTGGLAVALAVAALLVLPFGASGASAVLDHPSLLLGATAVALLSSVLSYGLEINALRRIPTRVFGILMSLEPAAAAIAGLVVLHQRLGLREVVALLLVSLASLGVTLARRGPAPPPVSPGSPTAPSTQVSPTAPDPPGPPTSPPPSVMPTSSVQPIQSVEPAPWAEPIRSVQPASPVPPVSPVPPAATT